MNTAKHVAPVSDWQPIETFDALKKKPEHAVFLFKAEKSRSFTLPQTIMTARTYGLRTCTHWMPIPEPPQ